MRKKIIYLGISTLLITSIFTVVFLKRQKAGLSKNNSETVMLAFTDKVASLSNPKNPDYLQENLTPGDIAKVNDEFERILIGKDLTIKTLKKDESNYRQWQHPLETLELINNKLNQQITVNSFFLSNDYREVLEQRSTNKEYQEIKKTKELLESADSTADTNSSIETETSTTGTSNTHLKNFAQLVAINGDKVNPYLIIQDDLAEKKLKSLMKELTKNKEKNNWDKSMLSLLKNAETQLTTIQKAETLVDQLFNDDEQVITGIATTQYTEALEAVESIYNQTHQQRLMDKMIVVAQSIGQELESKVYSYDSLTNKTDIIFTATQGNDKWWEGPLTFSVDVKNNSTKKISFNRSQFVIESKSTNFAYSLFLGTDSNDLFIINPGENHKLNDLTFNFKDENATKEFLGGYLSYLPKESLDGTTNSQTIKGILVATKPKEETVDSSITTTTSESTEVVSATVTEAQLKKSRKFLADYGIDKTYLTDGDLELLVIQSLSEQLTDEEFLRLVCDSLNIDYDQLIAEHSDSQ